MNAPAPVREAGPWPFDPEVRRVARELRDDMGGREAAATPSRTGVTVAFVHPEDDHHEALREAEANARLIAAAPLLLGEAQVLRCLATSPRFAAMTVADALAELSANGCGHDGGAALAKVQS